jgi:hypothetical protein
MNEPLLKDDAGAWTEAIAALRALSAEVNAGLLALSQNDLKQFEARIAAQEKLCDSLRSSGLFSSAKLRILANELKKAAAQVRKPQPAGTPAERLVEIHHELSHLNRVYATLVGRSQEIFGILIALRKGIREEYSREGKRITADHTWSCEV